MKRVNIHISTTMIIWQTLSILLVISLSPVVRAITMHDSDWVVETANYSGGRINDIEYRDGYIYMVETSHSGTVGDDYLMRFDVVDQSLETVMYPSEFGYSFPICVTWHYDNSILLADPISSSTADFGYILRNDGESTEQWSPSELQLPYDILALPDSTVIVADIGDYNGLIWSYSADGSSSGILLSEAADYYGLTIGPDGAVYVSAKGHFVPGADEILRLTESDTSLFFSGVHAWRLAFSPYDGNMYVAGSGELKCLIDTTGDGLPDRVDLIATHSEPNDGYLWNVTFDDDGGMWVSSWQTIFRLTSLNTCCIGMRGDVNYDSNPLINIADLTYQVAYLFSGGAEPPCLGEANVNGDPAAAINIADLTYLVAYLFTEGAAPVDCGIFAGSSSSKSIPGTYLSTSNRDGATIITLESTVDLRGLQLEIASGDGSTIQTVPVCLIGDQLDMLYHADANLLNVGILDLDGGEVIFSGTQRVIQLEGEYEIISALGSDLEHREVIISVGKSQAEPVAPFSYALRQNYPNPFNPTTTLGFSNEEEQAYTLTIYNVTGQVVQQFNGVARVGDNSVVWDASSSASGVYLYRLETATFTDIKKMMLLK